jgi:hypothetical protein
MLGWELIHILEAEQSGQFLPVYQRVPLPGILDLIKLIWSDKRALGLQDSREQ